MNYNEDNEYRTTSGYTQLWKIFHKTFLSYFQDIGVEGQTYKLIFFRSMYRDTLVWVIFRESTKWKNQQFYLRKFVKPS